MALKLECTILLFEGSLTSALWLVFDVSTIIRSILPKLTDQMEKGLQIQLEALF